MRLNMDRRVLQPKKRDDRGAALVEFSIVAVLLFTLIFGILVFGLLLSKKQTVVQAASEATRVGVPTAYVHSTALRTLTPVVIGQVNQSISTVASPARTCPTVAPLSIATNQQQVTSGSLATDGITCTVIYWDCTSTAAAPLAATGITDCLDVKVVVDNSTKPLVPKLLLLNAVSPASLSGESSVKLTCDATCQAS